MASTRSGMLNFKMWRSCAAADAPDSELRTFFSRNFVPKDVGAEKVANTVSSKNVFCELRFSTFYSFDENSSSSLCACHFVSHMSSANRVHHPSDRSAISRRLPAKLLPRVGTSPFYFRTLKKRLNNHIAVNRTSGLHTV